MSENNYDFNAVIVPVAKKLAKLVCQLGSDNTNVVDKAVRAILQTLGEQGCNLPDLAAVIERAALIERAAELLKQANDKLTKEEGVQIFQEAYARGRREAQAEQGNQPPTWRQMVDICWDNVNQLDVKDRAFISSIRPRVLFDDDEPSPKQQKWLKDCYRKVHFNGRASV